MARYDAELTDNIRAVLTTGLTGATVHITGGYAGFGCAGWGMVLADRLYRIGLVAKVNAEDGNAQVTVNGFGLFDQVKGCLDEIRLDL